MKTVITYGTFDLFHTGHLNLLKRARELGERLIVGVTSDAYDRARGKLNVVQSCAERIENVRRTGLADLIIIEEEEGQKVRDINTFNADIFAIGSDWIGTFDYLSEHCKVVYLERTRGSATAQPVQTPFPMLRIGIIGHGRIAERFLRESKYVSGIETTAVYGRSKARAMAFAQQYEIERAHDDFEEFIQSVDAVYVAVPHHLHVEFTKKALQHKKHVLCEKPMALSATEAEELFGMAKEHDCVLLEAIKTAYAPAFTQIMAVIRSGQIGDIRSIDANFTKLIKNKSLREYDADQAGGAMTELGSYALFVIAKLLGTDPTETSFTTITDSDKKVDIFTRMSLIYSKAIATASVGVGIKKEGDMCIAGTKGYIYVPAPWWKTEHFEIRGESPERNKSCISHFAGDGLRYELSTFLNMIRSHERSCTFLTQQESSFIARNMEQFRKGINVTYLQ